MENLLKETKEFKILFKESENFLMGKYFSKLKGNGLEFADLREYQAGDDIRNINWILSAKEGKPIIKEFYEEKDINHYVLLDVSASNTNKIEEIKKLAASLIFSSFKQNDSFSLIFFAEDFIYKIPLSKGKKHLSRCIYEISRVDLKKKGNLSLVLKKILSEVSKKALISIISDEFEINSSELQYLKALKQKHKVNYFHIFNSYEKELLEGLEVFEDIESGEEFIYDLNEEEILEYHKNYEMALKEIKEKLKRTGIFVYLLDSRNSLSENLKRNFNSI